MNISFSMIQAEVLLPSHFCKSSTERRIIMINIFFLTNNANNFTTASTSCKNNISNKPNIHKHKSHEKTKKIGSFGAIKDWQLERELNELK
jgi:hypothetical protein